jgi:hypothetical protein
MLWSPSPCFQAQTPFHPLLDLDIPFLLMEDTWWCVLCGGNYMLQTLSVTVAYSVHEWWIWKYLEGTGKGVTPRGAWRDSEKPGRTSDRVRNILVNMQPEHLSNANLQRYCWANLLINTKPSKRDDDDGDISKRRACASRLHVVSRGQPTLIADPTTSFLVCNL